MGQNKLWRFEQIKTFPNVLQYPENMAGKWHEHFGNDNPVTLELACGKGDYAVNMAIMFPDRNFIGVDVKGNRMFIGARRCIQENITNTAFLRTQIGKLLDYFAPGEVKEIWITFPDPFLRDGKAKNRLTHPKFLKLYQQVLPKGATINLKTDSTELYEFTREVIAEQGCTVHQDISNVYANGEPGGLLSIKTFYEQSHLAEGRIIKFISFSLPEHEIVVPSKKEKSEAATEGGN